jgi:hypothetical protein
MRTPVASPNLFSESRHGIEDVGFALRVALRDEADESRVTAGLAEENETGSETDPVAPTPTPPPPPPMDDDDDDDVSGARGTRAAASSFE